MVYISVNDTQIPVGNFTFIFDVTRNELLFDKFYDAERNLKIDYIDFSHKIRIAFEAFALEEEAKKRKREMEYNNKSTDEVKEAIIAEIKQPSSIINYKNIIIDLCKGREMDFSDMLYKYSYIKNLNSVDEVRRKLNKFIRFIYAFGSESSHENVKSHEKYIANKKNCFRVARSFHDFLCAYYKVNKKYDSTLIPIRDYIPISKIVCTEMGLSLDKGKYLYVKQHKDTISYYIFSSNIDSISLAQRRDIDTIDKLWEDNFDDPANIIRQTENINGSNGDYKFQVYSLPNKPLRLSQKVVNSLLYKDKIDIISGICKGIYSIHNYKPALYHRNINPDAFYIFEVKGKYKALLAKFDCTKDTSANCEFTVMNNVEKKVQIPEYKKFFAPEVIKSNMGQGVDWEKADVYSLAMTCLFILTGEILSKQEYSECLTLYDIGDDIKDILIDMLDENPDKRPKLRELMKFKVD